MKLGTRECEVVLEKFIPETAMEAMAVRVLLTPPDEVKNLPGMMELSNTQRDLLVYNIKKLKDRLEIEDEA